jgi:hypothetical protein
MRKHHIFRPSGWNSLEVRITPSAVGPSPVAEMVRIDAHVRHVKVHHHAHHQVHHVNHQGRPIVGGGTGGTGINVNGTSGGGGSSGSGGSGGSIPGGGTIGGGTIGGGGTMGGGGYNGGGGGYYGGVGY